MQFGATHFDTIVVAFALVLTVGITGFGIAAVVIVRNRLRLVQEALDTTSAAIAVYGPDDRLIIVNKSYRDVLGLPENMFRRGARYEDLVRRSLGLTLVGEDFEAEVRRRIDLQRYADGRPSDRRYPGGRWLRVNKVKTPSGANVGIALDVTEYYELSAALERQVRRFEALAASAPVGICQSDQDNRILFANGALLEMLDIHDLGEIGQLDMPFRLDGQQANGFGSLIEKLRRNGKESEVQISVGADARDFLVRKALIISGELESRVMPKGHSIAENIFVFIDITERKSNERRIRHLAHHDPLTGACNRLAFREMLDTASKAAEPGRPVSLVAIDLDRFKPVNDTYGHAVGDELLRQIVGRLSDALKDGMTLFRMGGDEFALLCPPGVEPDPIAFAQRLLETIAVPFRIQGHVILIGASAGVSALPSDTENLDTLSRYADFALYHAKREGGGTAIGFDQEILSSVDDRQQIELELIAAIEQDDFSLVYQPIFDHDRRRIVAVETLARWRRPSTGQLVPPERFIAQAESGGFIHRIDEHIFSRAVDQLARWSEMGVGVDHITINMSARTLAEPDIAEHLSEIMRRSRMPGRSVIIELTESFAVRDTEAVLKNMRSINDLGIRFAIDDFGTGYTSLRLVTELPIAFIKIDKVFVRALSTASGPNVRLVLRAIADLSKNMGLDMIAEGVETQAEFDALLSLECRYFQGNFLSKPLSADRIQEIIKMEKERQSKVH